MNTALDQSPMQTLILDPSIGLQQRIMLFGFGVIFFVVGGMAVLAVLFDLIEGSLTFRDIIQLLLFFVSFILFGVGLSKEGMVVSDDGIYRCYFLFGRRVRSEKINLKNVTDISILRFNMGQKAAIGVTLNPDQTAEFAEYRVYGLSENHAKRTLFYTTRNKEDAQRVIDAITNVYDLKQTAYNPPRSSRRRR